MAISLRDGRVKQSISPGKAADKRLRVTEESFLWLSERISGVLWRFHWCKHLIARPWRARHVFLGKCHSVHPVRVWEMLEVTRSCPLWGRSRRFRTWASFLTGIEAGKVLISHAWRHVTPRSRQGLRVSTWRSAMKCCGNLKRRWVWGQQDWSWPCSCPEHCSCSPGRPARDLGPFFSTILTRNHVGFHATACLQRRPKPLLMTRRNAKSPEIGLIPKKILWWIYEICNDNMKIAREVR